MRTTRRIAQVIARSGLCSRREAERWIAEGRVSLDGARVATPAVSVGADADIRVDGAAIAGAAQARIWRYHKPAGVLCTARDTHGRETVFSRLPASMPRVVSVGRLDMATEGLLLLTNDGALARRLELPAHGFERRYRARVFGRVPADALKRLAGGMRVEGVRYLPIKARIERKTTSHVWMALSLREGKNRELRRVLGALGLRVARLIRTGFGPFDLGALPRDAVSEVPRRKVMDIK